MEKTLSQEQWFNEFQNVYRDTCQYIGAIVYLGPDEIIDNLNTIYTASKELELVYQAWKHINKPPTKECQNIKKDFERTLHMCVQSGQMSLLLAEDISRNSKFVINTQLRILTKKISIANSYHDHLQKRIATFVIPRL